MGGRSDASALIDAQQENTIKPSSSICIDTSRQHPRVEAAVSSDHALSVRPVFPLLRATAGLELRATQDGSNYSSLFIINKAARQPPEERHLHSIQSLSMSPSAQSQVCNQQHIKHEQHPAHNTRPAENDV